MSTQRKGQGVPRAIANDRRRARKRLELPPDAACVFCGERNPDALLPFKRAVIEAHHAAGAVNEPELVVALCRTHHAIVTARGWDAGLDLVHERRTLLTRVAGALQSLAVFLAALADALLRFASQLLALESMLDRRYPSWRKRAEASGDA